MPFSGLFREVLILKLDVVAGRIGKEFPFGVFQGSALLAGIANIDEATFEALARGHHAASADNDFIFDHGAIIYDGAIAHQNAIAQSAAMEQSAMTDNDIVADDQWPAIWVKVTGVGNVQDSVVLNVGAIANPYFVHVASNHSPRPH